MDTLDVKRLLDVLTDIVGALEGIDNTLKELKAALNAVSD